MGYIILFLWIGAIVCFLIKYENNQKRLNKGLRNFNRFLSSYKKSYEKNDLNELMENAGIPVNLYHYQIIRLSLLVFLILMTMLPLFKGESIPVGKLILGVCLYLLTIPQTTFLGKSTPFQMVINTFMASKREAYNQELYMAVSQLKTTFMIKQDRPPSSDFIIEQIRKYAVKTRGIFNQMMSLWMVGEKELAIDYFEKEIGTKEAQKLGYIFLKLDELNPIEMKQQLIAFQEIYRQEKETKKLKSNETRSNFLFMFVVVSCLIIMVNFLVVVFFIDFLKDTQQLFM